MMSLELSFQIQFLTAMIVSGSGSETYQMDSTHVEVVRRPHSGIKMVYASCVFLGGYYYGSLCIYIRSYVAKSWLALHVA